MLPRRHILDVWEFTKDEKQLLSMATITLAVDAIKYLEAAPRKDHLMDALELNEFVCYMFPGKRPENRSLLFHVVSDLLGLLMYGVPRAKRPAIGNLQTMNYSEKNMDVGPIREVWQKMKEQVYTKKHGPKSIVDGFIKKIRIETAVMAQYPLVDELFFRSREALKEWLPPLSRYYGRSPQVIKDIYNQWWELWLCRQQKEKVLESMVERLCGQAEREFHIDLDRNYLFDKVLSEPEENRLENERFSRWYREGVTFLLEI
jgi:hypothetical protein